MNELRLFFPSRVRALRGLACAAGCALTAGCIADPFPNAKIDPNSPVAGDVARMARANADYPSFNEIPAIPKDIRPLALYGQQAGDLKGVRERIERETAPETWTLQDTTGFAERSRDAVPDIPPPTAADAEAFARELRERATPPPPR